jgi:hypothetical protein
LNGRELNWYCCYWWYLYLSVLLPVLVGVGWFPQPHSKRVMNVLQCKVDKILPNFGSKVDYNLLECS